VNFCVCSSFLYLFRGCIYCINFLFCGIYFSYLLYIFFYICNTQPPRRFCRFFCLTITFCARELYHRSGSVTLINYFFSFICLGIDWERIFLSYTFFHIYFIFFFFFKTKFSVWKKNFHTTHTVFTSHFLS